MSLSNTYSQCFKTLLIIQQSGIADPKVIYIIKFCRRPKSDKKYFLRCTETFLDKLIKF